MGTTLTMEKVAEHDRELAEQSQALNQATQTCGTMLAQKLTMLMEMEHKLQQVPNTSQACGHLLDGPGITQKGAQNKSWHCHQVPGSAEGH